MTHQSILAATTSPEVSQSVETAVNWWQSDIAREWLIAKPIQVAIILGVAIVVHWVLRRFISKVARHNLQRDTTKQRSPLGRLTRSKGKSTISEAAAAEVAVMNDTQEKRRKSRIKTLAGVARSTVAIIVWIIAGLAILDTLGVAIAPLIASAGVVGVALAFGAQSLVKDFLSGIFMLLEDQYGIGDTIDVGEDIIGDVENITLRLTTLRDIDGVLWFVRNGEIMRVGNCSARYSIARLQIPVSLSANAEEAFDVIKNAINEAIKTDPLKDWVIEEPDFKGVSVFEKDHISFRISLSTLPGLHWDVERNILGKILDAMNEHGIPTPYPNGIGIIDTADEEAEAES